MYYNQSGIFSNNNDFQFNNSIKVFISLYKFQQQLINNKDKNFPSKVILLDKKWFENYKDFYFCDKVFNLITKYNLTDFDLTEQKIIFNNLINEFSKKNSSLPSKDLLLFYDQEFPNIMTCKNNNKLKYIKDFEIVNEEIYENLLNSMGTFKYCARNSIEYDYKICKNKIIIKYINQNENCFNLLIGNIGEKERNVIYDPDILIYFPNSNSLNDEYNNFIDRKLEQYLKGSFDNNNDITNITHDSFLDNQYDYKIKFYVYLLDKYPRLTEVNSQAPKEQIKNKIKRETVVRSLICYYLNNEILKENIIMENRCFLINKNWIKKFKEFYEYKSLVVLLKNILANGGYISDNKQILNNNNLLNQLSNEILTKSAFFNNNETFNSREKSNINELSSINLFLIDFNYFNKALEEEKDYMKIYNNFEIIIIEKNNFIKELFPFYMKKYNKFHFFINKDHYFSFVTDFKSDKIINTYSIEEKNDEIYINNEFLIRTRQLKNIEFYLREQSIKSDILSLNYNKELIANLNTKDITIYLLNKSEFSKASQKKNNIRDVLFKHAEFIESIKTNDQKINNNFIYLIPKEYLAEYFNKYN